MVAIILQSCQSNSNPVVERISVKRIVNGEIVEDTSAYTVPKFKFINQFGDTVTEKDVAGKYFVADFFFTKCPSICPKMKAQMLRVYEKYGKRNDFLILSHTIDPKRDSVHVLFEFAHKLGIDKNWYFLTGDKEQLFATADKYLIAAQEDPESPGGFAHSGNFVLADKDGKIRGYYDGTNPESVDKLIGDLAKLFKENP
ncbi:MAG: SCO family protein [Chitinophagales bacterium]|nr:SCO family protein [Chitinophagales bacterium]